MVSGWCWISGGMGVNRPRVSMTWRRFSTPGLRLKGHTCRGAIHMFNDVTTELTLDTLHKNKTRSRYTFSWNSYSIQLLQNHSIAHWSILIFLTNPTTQRSFTQTSGYCVHWKNNTFRSCKCDMLFVRGKTMGNQILSGELQHMRSSRWSTLSGQRDSTRCFFIFDVCSCRG